MAARGEAAVEGFGLPRKGRGPAKGFVIQDNVDGHNISWKRLPRHGHNGKPVT